MSNEPAKANPPRKILSWIGYSAAIGLLLFILYVIFYSIWHIISTA